MKSVMEMKVAELLPFRGGNRGSVLEKKYWT